jgi:transcription elongation GreA/GreB family factor
MEIMSRAFLRESDTDAVGTLPDRPISPHPNFVTSAGYDKIEARLRELSAARAGAAHAAESGTVQSIDRELRYWRQRRSSARVIAPPSSPEIVRFGVTVRLEFEDGAERHFQLVGEDEADPGAGLISWTSPVGSALIGRRVGDTVRILSREATIAGMRA